MIHILLCAFNEERDIGPLLEGLASVLPRLPGTARVVLVDDGSSDRTVHEAKRVAAGLEGLSLTVVSHERNQGLGAALQTGFAHCLESAADDDVLVTLDADNTHLPKQIPALVEALGSDYDLAIASRYQSGAVVAGVPSHRKALSDVAGGLFRSLLPISGVRDYTCCFRAYRVDFLRRALACYSGALTREPGFAAVSDILIRLRPLGLRATEIPLELDYGPRVGASKMRVLRNIRITLSLLLRRFFEQRVVRRVPQVDPAEAA